MSLKVFLISLFFLKGFYVLGQINPDQKTSIEILHGLNKLKVLGNVLYLAAHPDDENTRLIGYLANEKLYNTSYLSLTRGDGGQNLIGSEQGELLGIIRTHELTEARKIDGGQQYFSRARDFGFSKLPDETFNVWDRNKVLEDVVWVIRNLKPDIIITRFSPEPGKTHGHHTASAMLALEAYEAAADPQKFSEQLKLVDTWKVKRIVWNTGRFFYDSEEKLKAESPLTLDIGGYNKLLGRSYGEISADSRTKHKSQGFGTAPSRGPSIEYFQHLKGDKAEGDLMSGVNTTWKRVPGTSDIEKLTDNIIKDFVPADPAKSVSSLVELYKRLDGLKEPYWKKMKQEQVKELIVQCLGIFGEVTLSAENVIAGGKVLGTVNYINRSEIPVAFKKFALLPAGPDTSVNIKNNNTWNTFSFDYTIPAATSLTHPFWLEVPGTAGMFEVKDRNYVALPEKPASFRGQWTLQVDGVELTFEKEAVFKTTDPVQGEIIKSIKVVPPVSLNVPVPLNIFPDNSPKVLTLSVRANKENTKGWLRVAVPEGWKIDKDTFYVELLRPGQNKKIEINIQPTPSAINGEVKFTGNFEGTPVRTAYSLIDYPHIGPQLVQYQAAAKLIKVDLKKKGLNIGYLPGAGDNVPAILQQIGYNVTILEDHQLTYENLKHFDALVAGVRLYNVDNNMSIHQNEINKYIENGGTYVVQYNTFQGLKGTKFGPYDLTLSNDRVTVEDATVKILAPAHSVFHTPNKIGQEDFTNWVQERGLYFASSWDKSLTPLLSMADPGENQQQGSLLVGQYGKGYFIYTSLSWFRQLPAGVPGACKIFVNLLSIGK